MGKESKEYFIWLPFSCFLLCLSCIAVIGLNTYRKLVFEHLSAFCEIAAENNPESEQYFLTALKEYQTLTEQEIEGNHYLGEIWLPCRRVFTKYFHLVCFLLFLLLIQCMCGRNLYV